MMTKSAALINAISTLENADTDALREIEAQFSGETFYTKTLTGLINAPEPLIADNTTWLIKALLDKGRALNKTETATLLKNAEAVTSWAAQLHICQSIRHLTISAKDARAAAQWLTPLLTHKRPFIRAWSLDALCALAQTHAAIAPDANMALQAAEQDSAASVRARARNLAENQH